MNNISFSSLAARLARTKFGQKALVHPDGPSIWKRKPNARVYCGIALIALSYLTCLPALAFLSYLSIKLGQPMIIVIGGPAVLIIVHIIFGAGVYLAGQNYAREALLRAAKIFLKKYA